MNENRASDAPAQLPFGRTLRSLEAEGRRGGACWIGLAAVLLALWLTWFLRAEIPVYAFSEDARLEALGSVHAVAADLAGRVIAIHADVGAEVEAGDVLFELDVAVAEKRLGEEQARENAARAEFESLTRSLGSERKALQQTERVRRSEEQSASIQLRSALAAAALAEREVESKAALFEKGIVSELELRRARAVAIEARAAADAAELALRRVREAAEREVDDRTSRLEQTQSQLAELEGKLRISRAATERLGAGIEQYRLRAPIRGRLAEVARLQPGSVVARGDHVASIVPAGELGIVAAFTPAEAASRVRVGQRAELRLSGFPWTRYGSLHARVARVSSEPRAGRLRVECALDEAERAMPVEHGAPGSLVVEIERSTPAEVVIQQLGKRLAARQGSGEDP